MELNDLRRSAMLFELLRLGEAAKHISPEFKQRHLGIPWQRLIDAGESTVGLDRHDEWDEHWAIAVSVIPFVHDEIRSILAIDYGQLGP